MVWFATLRPVNMEGCICQTATLQSDRYTLLYPSGRLVLHIENIWAGYLALGQEYKLMMDNKNYQADFQM